MGDVTFYAPDVILYIASYTHCSLVYILDVLTLRPASKAEILLRNRRKIGLRAELCYHAQSTSLLGSSRLHGQDHCQGGKASHKVCKPLRQLLHALILLPHRAA